jgi:hypothetical protein
MSRFLTFTVLGLILAVLCFGAWKVLHITSAGSNELPPAAQAALAHPTTLVLATITKAGRAGPHLGGYAVVASAAVTAPELRQQAANTLLACVSDVGQSPECFEPTLAIHLTSPEGDFVFLPCFKCGHMKVVQTIPGGTEEWAWVEIRATGNEFGPLLRALHLPLRTEN